MGLVKKRLRRAEKIAKHLRKKAGEAPAGQEMPGLGRDAGVSDDGEGDESIAPLTGSKDDSDGNMGLGVGGHYL